MLFFPVAGNSQSCPATTLINRQVRASETDSDIPAELVRHQVWVNPECQPNELLLVHLVGSFDSPGSTKVFPAMAANHGYRVVSLKYINSLSAQMACRNSPEEDCYENFRREIIEGVDSSEDTEVDRPNSIENRLLKLLVYLQNEFPEEGWNSFYEDTTLIWDQIAVSGHSQGGGHAAFLAKERNLQRVVMFAAPNDYSAFFNGGAAWTSATHQTPTANYYALGNRFDEVVEFREEYLQWSNLGMNIFGDTVLVDTQNPPYQNTRMLYTNITGEPGVGTNHSLMIIDDLLPLDDQGNPIFIDAWKYMLGIDIEVNTNQMLPTATTVNLFPNPFTEYSTFSIAGKARTEHYLKLFAADGRIIQTYGPFRQEFRLERKALTSGIYFYQILTDGRPIKQGQIIIH